MWVVFQEYFHIFKVTLFIFLIDIDQKVSELSLRTFTLLTSALSNHDGCDEWTSRLSPTPTSTATADKLSIFVSQHQALLDI